MKKTLVILILGVILLLAVPFDRIKAAEDNPASDLAAAITKKDNKAIKKAVDKLILQNDEKAFNALSNSITSLGAQPEQEAYILILNGIARLTNKEVITKTTNLIINNRSKDLGRDLLGVMKSNRSPVVIPLLSAVLEKCDYEMQMECIHQLGSINAKESIEAIVNFLRPIKAEDKDRKEIVKGAIAALKSLTGQDRGNYPEGWVVWWDENKSKDVNELVKRKGMDASSIEHVGQYRDMSGVKTLEADKVLVVRNNLCDNDGGFDGNFDHIQDILARLEIPYTLIGKTELDKESYSLADKWVLIFNCTFFKDHCSNPEHKKLPPSGIKGGIERTQQCPGTTDHKSHNSKLSEKTIKKIKEFVETGGYLFTEDLNIEEIIERAFKGTITHTKFLPERTVKIMPAQGQALHPYLKYVFEAPPSLDDTASDTGSGGTNSVKSGDFRVDSEWKIDDESPDIKILKKDVVTVLIASPDLAKSQKSEGAVAVTFGASNNAIRITGGSKGPSYEGGGRVLHVMSHFGKQRSKLDEFALQNLILNFLMELNDRRPKSTVKK